MQSPVAPAFPIVDVSGSKLGRRHSWSSGSRPLSDAESQSEQMRMYSLLSAFTNTSAFLTFYSDSGKYEQISGASPSLHADARRRPRLTRTSSMIGTAELLTAMHADSTNYSKALRPLPELPTDAKGGPTLIDPNTSTVMEQSLTSNNLRGDGWPGRVGKKQEREAQAEKEKDREKGESSSSMTPQPPHPASQPPGGSEVAFSNSSRSAKRSEGQNSTNVTARQANIWSALSHSTPERKVAKVHATQNYRDTTERLYDLRRYMAIHTLDYYIVPSEDAHGSEYVAESDQRRQFISGYYGRADQAIITMSSAYLFTASRDSLQAKSKMDRNWILITVGAIGEPKDWIEWLASRAKDSRIGVDARMISYEQAVLINHKISQIDSKLVHPPQNLVDLVWLRDRPEISRAPVFIQPIKFSGVSAAKKIANLRDWIRAQPPTIPSHFKGPVTRSQIQTATLITSLSYIAYLLNLRGSDIPHHHFFHAYLYVSLESATIFLDASKVPPETSEYLQSLGIERRQYSDLWMFLRRREWGEGKLLISPQTSYAISLMLTHFRYTVTPSWIEQTMAVKNETELEGLRRAYLRDGASFVRFLAWLENKLNRNYEITEFEAAFRLTEYQRHNKNFLDVAYKSISATGSNAALSEYTPTKSIARLIERDTPYLNGSGGRYRDGICHVARTVHFGRPSAEQCEAFTRVLQGHIAIDSAVFPASTPEHQLDALARKALWRIGYMHGTARGFDSFSTFDKGRRSFSTNDPLVPGHVVTNGPGFYKEHEWGVRIESALAVRSVKDDSNGTSWFGFERLTCVPIQTRMVKDSMLTKEERAWLKSHNQRCLEKLTPLLKDDKRAMVWLKKEVGRRSGIRYWPW